MAGDEVDIRLVVNGQPVQASVEARTTLADFLRIDQGLTGTHIGCEQGSCGACTVAVDGQVARSCLMFAVQAEGRDVQTIEHLAETYTGDPADLHPVQRGFHDAVSFQCAFCAPGFIMVTRALLDENPDPTDTEIRQALAGNLCRCTGYESIIAGVRLAARYLRGDTTIPAVPH